jgi:hypothetical protein
MIVSALVAGMSKGLGDTVSTAVGDAYAALKASITRRFAGDIRANMVLEEHQSDPETWNGPLLKVMQASGADTDQEIIAAARKLLLLTDPAEARPGKFVIDTHGGNIGLVGDHGQQTNYFGVKPEHE